MLVVGVVDLIVHLQLDRRELVDLEVEETDHPTTQPLQVAQ